jgi:4-hydroxy-tetrahydrodipicolinate synthase
MQVPMRLDVSTRGTLPIVPTPFDRDGDLLLEGVRPLVDYYVSCGVSGLTILGVFGEAQKLSAAETESCIKEFLRCAYGRLPVIVGVTSPSLARSVELGRFALGCGAAGVMLQPMSGLRTDDAVVAFFERYVAESKSEIPICVMDDPASSGVQISLEAWCRISRLEPVFMLKHEPVPGLQALSRILEAQKCERARAVSVFTSSNAMWLPQELARGAYGTMVGVAYSDAIALICKLHWSGAIEKAADLHDAISPIIRHEKQGAFGLAVRKELLRRRGALTSAALRYPGASLDAQDLAELDKLVKRLAKRLAELDIALALPIS